MRAQGCLVLTGVFVMGVLEGCGGGGGGGTFTTSVPGDKPLGGLTGAEADQLCRDQNKFISESTYQMDMCRISAYLAAAFTATLSTTATDAELRTSCSDTYTQCLNPDPDGGAGAGGTCGAPPPSCTATVAELAACLNDEVAQYHALARQIPECGSLTRAGLVETDGGSTPGLTELPASCQTVQSKCGGPSDAATAFAAQYCALVDPCCAAAGLGSQCAGVVAGAAFSGPFDETAAAACLDALRQRQAGPDFCGGLAAVPNVYNLWAVIPECAAVFQSPVVGTTPPGGACTMDSDCAPGPNGGATCAFLFNDGTQMFEHLCLQISTKASDGPCIGTVITGFGFSLTPNAPALGVLCDQSQVVCDDVTHSCVPVPNDTCDDITQCDNVTRYCNFTTHRCEARLPLGATCAGSMLSECEGTAYCNATTRQCTAPGGAGAACSTTFTTPSDCLAGYCSASGICPSPLGQVCSAPL